MGDLVCFALFWIRAICRRGDCDLDRSCQPLAARSHRASSRLAALCPQPGVRTRSVESSSRNHRDRVGDVRDCDLDLSARNYASGQDWIVRILGIPLFTAGGLCLRGLWAAPAEREKTHYWHAHNLVDDSVGVVVRSAPETGGKNYAPT